MKSRFLIIALSFLLIANWANKQKSEVPKGNLKSIQTFSMGYPNINFPIQQSEKTVRAEGVRKLLSRSAIMRIEEMFQNLVKSNIADAKMGSITGIADLRYSSGDQAKIYFDGVHIFFDGEVYLPNEPFLDTLFNPSD